MSDFEKTLLIIGAVGRVAAIASQSPYSPYYYYRYHYHHPPVVVVEPYPVIVEKHVVVETPVIVDRQIIVQEVAAPNADASVEQEVRREEGEGLYSLKLGASFNLEPMQIPGYAFTAARLTSDPVEGSPLHEIGLRAGDAVTRLNGAAVTELEVLEQQEGETEIRYIKSGSTRVLLASVYIPTDDEILNEAEVHYAP
jgi:hypothetical protein